MSAPSPAPPEINVEAMHRMLVLLALFGAARKDATPEQVDRLKAQALPMLRDHSNPLQWVVEKVFEIMGPGWDPLATHEFGPWLTQLLAERRTAKR